MTDIPAAILDQAVDWVVRLGADGQAPARLRAQADAWRAADALHEAAWQELAALDNALDADLRRLRPLPSGLALRTLEDADEQRRKQTGRRKALRLLGLGAVGLGTAALVPPWRQWTGLGADYTTGTGQRRTVNLADGTRVMLNTGSAIDVRFSAVSRLLVLIRGEIFVHPGRAIGGAPLRIETAQARLEASDAGSDARSDARFLVRQQPGITRVSVAEGAVTLSGRDGRVVRTGTDLMIGADASVTTMPTAGGGFDPLGWIDGALVARQMRLADFIAELGRYREGWLACDPAIASLRVSGVYQIDDTDHALAALARALPVRLVRRTRYWVTLAPA